MNKTIKEFAEELGVTRQTIQYHVTKSLTKELQKNDKGISVLSLEEQEFIRKKLSIETDKRTVKKTSEKNNEMVVSQYEQIKTLREQNSDLRKLLDQQQQLQLRTQKQLEDKTLLLETDKEDVKLMNSKYEAQLFKIEHLYKGQLDSERDKTRIFFYLLIALSSVIVILLGFLWL